MTDASISIASADLNAAEANEPRGRRTISGGDVAVVTGAAKGIGAAVARRLLEDGWRVVAVDRDETALEAFATEARSSDALSPQSVDERLLCQTARVSEGAEVEEMIRRTIRAFGRVDLMVSNAGIAELHDFLDLPLDVWRNILDVNLTGVLVCGQAAARQMRQQATGGSIVNVASLSGLAAGTGRTAYGTSKAGVIHLTKQMALDLGRYGIRVNCVAPGPVDTPMTRFHHTDATRRSFTSRMSLGRYGQPDEIAGVVAFLAGRDSSFVTGQTIAADGGFTSAGVLEYEVGPMAATATAHIARNTES